MKNSYSLALGGGAARGFAHIGVIKYLEENNIKIKEVSGTSMGAIIASCIAIGMNSQDMIKFVESINFLRLIDFDFKKGLVKGKKVYDKLYEILGDKKIEDCQVKLKIISTNLATGQKVIFTKGKIIEAVRASISVPGIMTPHIIDSQDLIDGGIVNNLPIEVLEGNDIIAVSVLRDIGRKIITHNNIFSLDIKKSMFGIGYQILQKTIDIMMKQNEDRSISTSDKNIILIHPIFENIDYHHFHKYTEIINIGYEEAKKILSKI